MAAYSNPGENVRKIETDSQLQSLVTAVEQEVHQGVPLIARDYVALAVLTVVVPIVITIWGFASL